MVASVALIRKFASDQAEHSSELSNRDTGPIARTPLRSAPACGETRARAGSRPRRRHDMSEPSLKSINVGKGQGARRIAVRLRDGRAPGAFWLGGFKSDMQGTKAVALDEWAAKT